MKRIEIIEICDQCGNEFVEGQTQKVEAKAFGNTYEADLCTECSDDILCNFRTVKTKRKRKPKRDDDPVPGIENEYPCGYLDCDRVFRTWAGLRQHQSKSGH